MRRAMSAIVLLGLAAPVTAQAPGPILAAQLPRPKYEDALRMAQAALAACRAQGSHVLVLVVDPGNLPVVSLADDGSDAMAQILAPRKTALALKYKVPTSETADRAKTDAALAAEIKADPKIGYAFPGGLPIIAEGRLLGAIAVSGGASPQQDAACAAAGLAKAGAQLR